MPSKTTVHTEDRPLQVTRFPEDLRRKIKAHAATLGVEMRLWIIARLAEALDKEHKR